VSRLALPEGLTIDEVVDAAQADECAGFCLGCGDPAEDNVEPDARGYRCGECGENKVYGAEEIVLMFA